MNYDVVIVGGGLAGSLLFAALRHHHPRIRLLLVEQNSTLGGNHTWCFHDHDIPARAHAWLTPLISKTWPGYEVFFPKFHRIFSTSYHGIRSEDLHAKLIAQYSKNILLGAKVLEIKIPSKAKKTFETSTLILENHEPITAATIIEATGWPPAFPQGSVAYQKFVGLEVQLAEPHGLQQVILKDATVQQVDGYRFFYVLPWAENQLLIEDTYYSHHAILKEDRIEQEIHKYAEAKGWKIEKILRKEVGSLPLPLYSQRSTQAEPGAAPPPPHPNSLGAQSLHLHVVTGYTCPQTFRSIQALIENSSLSQESVERVLTQVRSRHQAQDRYFRFLNRMMFLAAEPLKRYLILQRFYTLPESLIQRFYSGELNRWDQLRLLLGKPPVPISKALKVIRDR